MLFSFPFGIVPALPLHVMMSGSEQRNGVDGSANIGNRIKQSARQHQPKQPWHLFCDAAVVKGDNVAYNNVLFGFDDEPQQSQSISKKAASALTANVTKQSAPHSCRGTLRLWFLSTLQITARGALFT
jgi:hypothetical protein